MALDVGDEQATSGMSKAIFDALSKALAEPPPDVQTSWQKLSFAIATGVVAHLKSNLEITGVSCTGTATTSVTGQVNGTAVTGQASGTVTLNQTGSARAT